MTLNVVCVHTGDYCGRGAEYVRRLLDGVAKHLKVPYTPWCLTDDAGMIPIEAETLPVPVDVKGWWGKIELFRPNFLPQGERCLYFDLDTIITGDLTDIAAYTGKFAALRDFYFKGNLNSAMMAWEAGTLDHIWRVWDRCGRPQFITGGDQAWIEQIQPEYDQWQELIPNQIFSYKIDCQNGVPDNARVVCYHGQPRPHETEMWK